MQVVECCPSSTRVANVIPRFVREPLDVVGKVAGEVDNGGAQTRFRANPALAESCLDKRREYIGRDLVETHDWTGLVERPLWSNHLFHEARLRSREDVADRTLMLRRGAQRMFDA